MNWRYDIRCNCCRRFMRIEAGCAWEAHGDFGEEIEHTCKACVSAPDYTGPVAGNGSPEGRWCGFVR